MGKKSVRSAQLISPFGPGAVIDLGSEAFVCTDTGRWPAGECHVLPDNALQQVLGLEIRTPPVGERAGEIPYSRFPRWLFCPSCSRLYNYSHALDAASDFGEPICAGTACNKASLVPMRFVVACEGGHLQDVDWHRWAHRNVQVSSAGLCDRSRAELYFETTGASGGDFNAMRISCRTCDTKNSFEGLTSGPYVFGCNGRQPWQLRNEEVQCQANARVFPRAASNVYYPQTRSALDIGVDSEDGENDRLEALKRWLSTNMSVAGLRPVAKIMPDWRDNKALYQHIVAEAVRTFHLPEDIVAGEVLAEIAGRDQGAARQTTQNDRSQHGILMREWPHLSRATPIRSDSLRTHVFPLRERWPADFSTVFEQVTLVERLREVRALVGFRRVKPDTTSVEVPVDLGRGLDWLPGIRTFGEGIFLKLSEDHVARWESRIGYELEPRMTSLAAACAKWGREPERVYASVRFIALHTLAHGLIRRLAFDAGYSSSSIRERVYCSGGGSPAAGILLYTADSDSEGSLGGLVRQGKPERLLGTVMRTISDLAWCSADPVCTELEAQGIDGMNSAACHACALVSETSCSFNNSLLDRRLVVGSQDRRIPGLLEAWLAGGAAR